jgi:mannan endo-1,4-beta-mannosidase
LHNLKLCVAAIAAMAFGGASDIATAPARAEQDQKPVELRAGEFVRTNGTSFVLQGRRFQVVGANNHYLTFGSKEEVTSVLDDAVAMGANVVRTFIQPVIGADDGSMKNVWNWESRADSSNLGAHGVRMLSWDAASSRMVFHDDENGLQRLDFLLTEARRRNLRLILAFLDFWPYMGGAPQISAWYGSADKYTFFAKDPRTRKAYKDWVRHVVLRVNDIDGTAYKDDPAIFAWELMNEPDIHPNDLLLEWVTEMAAFVKEMDANHLLATGHSNIVNRLADLPIPNIDFGTWHGYPAYEKISIEQFDSLIRGFCDKGKKAGKPVILEEFGVARSDQKQAEAYRMWSATIRRNLDCAGWVVWRLVSRQDGGNYPDDHDGFDVVNDGGDAWMALKEAARLANSADPVPNASPHENPNILGAK